MNNMDSMKISHRVRSMDASGIREVFAMAHSVHDPIDCSIGQPHFSVPRSIKDAACDAITADHSRYTPTNGIERLRERIATVLRDINNINAHKDSIIITTAVSGGLSVILPCIIDHGDEVIIFDPSFVGYKQVILLYGGTPVRVVKNDDFSINFSALQSAITQRTRAIIFNTPENPTGYVSTQEEIAMLAKIAQEHGLLVISDEIYQDFVYEGMHHSIGALYDQTVTVGGFSKSHAMTGWRIGYMHVPDALIDSAIKVQQYTFVCAPTPLQYAALEAIDTPIDQYVQLYREKRDKLYDGIKDLYHVVRSSGAFYFYVTYPYDPQEFLNACIAHDLLIVPGSVFSDHNTHFRISYAVDDAVLDRAIRVLRAIAKTS